MEPLMEPLMVQQSVSRWALLLAMRSALRWGSHSVPPWVLQLVLLMEQLLEWPMVQQTEQRWVLPKVLRLDPLLALRKA
jgi:hypothetical protein